MRVVRLEAVFPVISLLASDMEKERFETKRISEWTKSLFLLPALGDVAAISHRPQQTACNRNTKQAAKFVQNGHVQHVLVAHSSEETSLVKCKVLASVKQAFYNVYIELSVDGTMMGAYCECVAGKRQSCRHITALLYFIKQAQTQGIENTPDVPTGTSTDVTCGWIGVTHEKTARAPLDETIIRHKAGKEKNDLKPLQFLDFDPRHPDDRSVDAEAFSNFYEGLKKIHPMLGFCKYGVPLPPLPAPDLISDSRNVSCILQHPACSDLSSDSREELCTLQHPACSSIKASVQFTKQETEDLEETV